MLDSESGAFDLLVELYRRHGRIVPARDRLNVSGPADALPSWMQDALAEHKPVLMSLLGSRVDEGMNCEGIPLSNAQQEIWMAERATPGTRRFNLVSSVLLEGVIDVGAANDALNAIIERHPALRTRFAEDLNTVPHQFVGASTYAAPEVERGSERLLDDLQELLQRVAVEQTNRLFDLASDPLLGLHITIVGGGHTLLTLRRHHIANDGTSFAVIVDEFCRFYRAFTDRSCATLDYMPSGYPAFVAYEAAVLERQGHDALRAWWRDELAHGASLLSCTDAKTTENLPYASENMSMSSLDFVVDATIVGALRALSKRCGESLYSTMFGLFGLVLHACRVPNAQCVGIDSSMRDATDFERTAGLFINRLPVIYAIDPLASFESMVADIGRTIRAALAHKWLPYYEISAIAKEQEVPLFQYLFGFHNNPHAAFNIPDCRVATSVAHREHEHDVPFVCYLTDVGASITVTVAYRPIPHVQTLADDFATTYLQLARFAAVMPHSPCGTFVASGRTRQHFANTVRRRAFSELKRRRAPGRPLETGDE